ncbi:MAG: hypothetical protein JO154_21025 [Chitinophaga sp.]|uniref:hypothetical protein n=1 Tax=Chitinophaga sp. TaxID=1869181 RepID=UPI0025C3B6EB|nr:hypothetical protein [Chitinophaga sp.]MBV8255098.1 hypothetical protein [Chitinophaga sp.]
MKKISILIICLFTSCLSFAQLPGGAVSLLKDVYIYSTTNSLLYRLTTNNYLVTHNEIRQKISQGYFTALNLNAIPADNNCITATNAKLWISIDATKLPTNGRLPVWQELVPKASCTGDLQKMINGVCETAVWRCYDQELDHVDPPSPPNRPFSLYWYRVYSDYVWSDGTRAYRSTMEVTMDACF